MFITFDGIDGAGKTYLVKKTLEWLLCLNVKAVAIKSPPEPYSKIDLDTEELTRLERALFYVSANINISEFVDKEDCDVILCDRYLNSTLSYFDDVFRNFNLEDVIDCIKKPSVSICVTIQDESVRQSRFKQRIEGKNGLSDLLSESQSLLLQEKILKLCDENIDNTLDDCGKNALDSIQKIIFPFLSARVYSE